jgi:putative flippase GtrA
MKVTLTDMTQTTLLSPGTAPQSTEPTPRAPAILDVVIPVYNEETDLGPCVHRLHHHLATTFPYAFQITIADNASTDGTLAVARTLENELPGVHVLHLTEKGRGRALAAAWSASPSPILSYMDVDLSTDLAALLPLVAPLISGHSDVAIGTRLARGSRVVRGLKREAISRAYNLLLRGTLAVRFSDAQCGFKAISKDAADELLPLIQDTGWFFDTELLVLAQRAGLRIHEVPVDWVDDPDSRVDIVSTAIADLKGIVRLARGLATRTLPLPDLRRQVSHIPLAPPPQSPVPISPAPAAPSFALLPQETEALMLDTDAPTQPSMPSSAKVPPDATPANLAPAGTASSGTTPLSDIAGVPAGLPRQLVRFVAIGVISTLAYVALFSLLRLGLNAQPANLVALLVTAIANTAANRRLTFGITGRRHAARHQMQGLIVFGLGLALTSGSLAVLHAVSPTPPTTVELSVLVVANLAATVLRFVLLRLWMFHRRAVA